MKRSNLIVLVVALLVGVTIAKLRARKAASQVRESLVAKELNVVRPDGTIAIQMTISDTGPMIKLKSVVSERVVEAGVNSEGLPWLSSRSAGSSIVGEAEGQFASPLLTFKGVGEGELEIGLTPSEKGVKGFLSYGDGVKKDFIGLQK